MSTEILGHDIHGRPVRIGDQVRLVGPSVTLEFRGEVRRVEGRKYGIPGAYIEWYGSDWLLLDDGSTVPSREVARIDRPQPAGQSFQQITDSLRAGVPA